jgi:hypothetical protein
MVPVRKTRDFNAVSTSFSRNKWPSVRCAIVANHTYNDANMFDNNFFNTSLLVNLVNRQLQQGPHLRGGDRGGRPEASAKQK